MPGTEAQANGVDWARWMRALAVVRAMTAGLSDEVLSDAGAS